MAISWERAVPLAFHLCCSYFSAVLNVGVPLPLFCVKDWMWDSIVAVPDLCLSIFLEYIKIQDSVYSVCI